MEVVTKQLRLKPRKQTRRQQRAEETKRKIMETAISLFARHGYDNVSIGDITREAGLAKGTFYCHYSSKVQVVLQSLDEFEQASHDFYRQAMKESNPIDQFLVYIRCITDYSMAVMGLDRLKVIYSSYINNERLGRTFLLQTRPIYIFMEKILQAGQRESVFRQDIAAMELAMIMVYIARSCVFEWCVDNGAYDLTEITQKRFRRAMEILTPALTPSNTVKEQMRPA